MKILNKILNEKDNKKTN